MNHTLITTVCAHISVIFWCYLTIGMLITAPPKDYIKKMSCAFGSTEKQTNKKKRESFVAGPSWAQAPGEPGPPASAHHGLQRGRHISQMWTVAVLSQLLGRPTCAAMKCRWRYKKEEMERKRAVWGRSRQKVTKASQHLTIIWLSKSKCKLYKVPGARN